MFTKKTADSRLSIIFYLILAALIVKQLVITAFVPAWQFPDEQAHFGQVANSAVASPLVNPLNLSREILVSERILQTERDWAGNNRYTYHPEYNIPYTDNIEGGDESEINNLPVDSKTEMVKIESTYYPPLYYLPLTVVYKFFFSDNLFIRLFLARVTNLGLFLLTALIVYKTFLLVFKKKFTALVGLTIFCFQPMFSFTQGGVNSDNLFNLLFTLAIYLSLLMIKNGINIRIFLLCLINYILAVNSKPQGYLVLLLFIFPVVYHLVRSKQRKIYIFGFSLALISTAVIFLTKPFLITRFLPDVYGVNKPLDHISYFSHLSWSLKYTYQQVIPWFWGVFRWLSMTLPRSVNRIINRVILLVLIGTVLKIIKIIRKKDYSFPTQSLFFFIYSIIIYFLALTYWDYLFRLTHGFSFGIQGRYYLPILCSLVGIIIFSVSGFTAKRKLQQLLLLILSLGAIVLQELAVFNLLISYFPTTNIHLFFLQASQYKPWFFKSPVLEYIVFIHLVTIVFYIYGLVCLKKYEQAEV